MRCKQSLLWACVDRCGADGSPLPSGEGSDDRSWALVTSGEALPARTSSRREAAHGAASALEAKITKNAHGWRGESSLRLCGIALSCEPATEVRKCLARGTSPQNAPASKVAAAACDASSPAHPKACLLGCIAAEASCMGVGDTGG